MVNFSKFFFVFLIFSFSFFSSYSAVEVFSQYNTNVEIFKNNTMDVHKEMYLKNIHTVGIVPGSVEFRINKKINNSVSSIDIENIRVYNRYGSEINHKVLDTNDYVIIALEIFQPLIPGAEYKIDLYYTINFNPSGLFFKNLEIPVKEITAIPINEGSFNMKLPEGYHFTYVSYESNTSVIEKNSAFWNLEKEMPSSISFEYSYIPLNFGNIKGSVLFWILINIFLFLLLFREIRKEVGKFKNVSKK